MLWPISRHTNAALCQGGDVFSDGSKPVGWKNEIIPPALSALYSLFVLGTIPGKKLGESLMAFIFILLIAGIGVAVIAYKTVKGEVLRRDDCIPWPGYAVGCAFATLLFVIEAGIGVNALMSRAEGFLGAVLVLFMGPGSIIMLVWLVAKKIREPTAADAFSWGTLAAWGLFSLGVTYLIAISSFSRL